jgi:hypothetical protein
MLAQRRSRASQPHGARGSALRRRDSQRSAAASAAQAGWRRYMRAGAPPLRTLVNRLCQTTAGLLPPSQALTAGAD